MAPCIAGSLARRSVEPRIGIALDTDGLLDRLEAAEFAPDRADLTPQVCEFAPLRVEFVPQLRNFTAKQGRKGRQRCFR